MAELIKRISKWSKAWTLSEGRIGKKSFRPLAFLIQRGFTLFKKKY
jgi:hypothetical protein